MPAPLSPQAASMDVVAPDPDAVVIYGKDT
jgi:hypothetical protein